MSMKFDVVIPAANAAETLERAADSVLSSSVLGKLIIVVDDGDVSFDAAQKVALKSLNVRVFYSNAEGPGAARNRGLQECESEWVAFLDADDEYAPGYLEALAKLVEEHPELPMVHTNVVRRIEQENGFVKEHDDHPLRFRFDHGDRVVDMNDEPHMVGMSVAAAAFNREALVKSKVKFTKSLPWSEDADFIVRFLLAFARNGGKLQVGMCASAVYRYYVGNKESTSASAWSNPNKYLLPFTDVYLPWTYLARRGGGQTPEWLQNVLLYELFWYVDADRQVFHDSRFIDKDTLARCARLVQQVMASVSYETVQKYALTKVSLDRRMMLAAHSAGAPSAPLNGHVIAYAKKPWQKDRKYTYFFTWETPVEEFPVAGQLMKPKAARWVSHELFGVEMVRERILWLPASGVEARLDRRHTEVAPYAGLPKLPTPSSEQAPQAILVTSAQPVVQQTAEPQEGLFTRARKAFWHMRNQPQESAPATRQVPVVKQHQLVDIEPMGERVWFYMDRAHRAGDNAEVFYRYAASRVEGVKHMFALSSTSPDWSRLEKEGFNLVDADDQQALLDAIHMSSDLLLSDISDEVLAPLAGVIQPNQRVVFLQHGVTRKQVWRWMNARRIDALVTSTTAESLTFVGDGSHYTLSAPEIWQTGMPRLESLVEKRAAESRRDVLLIAPTWVPELRDTSSRSALLKWVNTWTTDWLPEHLLAEGSAVKPVFFVHPNMESILERFSVPIPVEAVYGDGLQDALVRAVATVTDRSSVADDGNVIGVPSFMVLPAKDADPFKVREGYSAPGFTLVESLDDLAPLVQQVIDDPAEAELPVAVRGQMCEMLVDRLLAQ